MGFDEENLVPFSIRKKNNHNFHEKNKSYLLINDDEKRQIHVSTVRELYDLVQQKFNLDENRIEFWSECYQDWVLFENELPDNNSKIRISSNNKLKNSDWFVENLNSAFKSYMEADTGHNLENFETAVIFLLKRSRDKLDDKDHLAKSIQQHSDSLRDLSDEIKILKTTLKQFKSDIECLNEKISFPKKSSDNFDIKKKLNRKGVLSFIRKNRKKSSCIIT